MKVLRGTLTFVLGMILGIILLIVAIVGTVFGITTQITVGDLQQKVGLEGESAIIDAGSEAENKSLWDLGKSLIDDFGNFSNMSLREIADKYGLNGKLDSLGAIIDGIDFSPIFEVPISEIGSSVHLIVENITLDDIGTLAGIDFGTYDIPVIKDNLYNSVTKAIDEILSGIDGDNMTLRQIEENFGLTLGENAIFDQIKDSPLSAFGSIVNGLEVGTIIDADCDAFILNGANPVYVKVNRYEQVGATEIDSVKAGATTYVAGADDEGNLIYKELRFVEKTTTDENGDKVAVTDEAGNPVYKVDNSCYTAAEEGEESKVYYRFVEYEKATATNLTDGAKLYLQTYSNHFTAKDGSYAPIESGFIALDTLTIAGTAGTNIIVTSADKYLDGETLVNMEVYGKDVEEYPSADTRLIAGGDESYLLVHKGTSDTAIQAIARTTVSGLNNATDSLMALRLCDLIEINDESPAILLTLKDTALKDLSKSIDTLILGDVIDITYSAYVKDSNGIYVYVSQQATYKPAASDFTGDRYVANFATADDGKYVAIDGAYYLYDENNADMAGLTRYEKTFVLATAEEIANDNIVKYERIDNGGYYTLYNPDEHDGMQRYSKLTDKSDSTAPDYILATSAQIADSAVVKYYWDGTAMQTTAIEGTPAYVKGSASSKVLQRLESVSIADFSDSFSELVLGDVLDIEMDVYVTATAPFADTVDYYYFENGSYKIADVHDSTFMATHADTVFYEISVAGASNAVLKKLAFTKVDDVAAKMDEIIDDMRLNEVIDITVDLYMPDVNGKFVYVANGGYYTLFNPAIHSETATRYSKIVGLKDDGSGNMVEFSYVVASAEQIADDSIVKYYWNGTAMQTSAVVGATAYVEGTVSSSTLQRFAKVKIGDFSAAFDEVILSDVIAIDGDVYEKANALDSFTVAADTTDESKTYFIYSAGNYDAVTRTYIDANPTETYYEFVGGKFYRYVNGVYVESDPVFVGSHTSEQYYELTASGTTHAVLRKMAYLPVNELGNSMDTVINDMYLKDLIGINEYDVVQDSVVADSDESARWLVEKDDNYTSTVGGVNYYYTFTYDINGKYYLRSDVYQKLTAEQLAKFELGTITYGYTQLAASDAAEFAIAATTHPYMFYCTDASAENAEYSLNPALSIYLASKGTYNKTYYRDTTASGYSGKTYRQVSTGGSALLYVNFNGVYVPYDATNPAHSDMDIYIHLENGYTLNANGDYFIDYTTGDYVSATSSNTIDLAFAKLPAKTVGSATYYYYAKLDSEYHAAKEAGYSIITFSKNICDDVYIVDEDGDYTFFNGDYVLKTSLPAGAVGEGSYSHTIAYVAAVGENYLQDDSGTLIAPISTRKVQVVTAKSAHVIRAFATHDVKVGSLDNAMKTFTLSDLMTIEPDSLFDDEDVKSTTLDNLGKVFQTKLQEMTVNDLLDWGNISSLKPEVLSIIGNVRLEKFFDALEYTNGNIMVNLEKLFA